MQSEPHLTELECIAKMCAEEGNRNSSGVPFFLSLFHSHFPNLTPVAQIAFLFFSVNKLLQPLLDGFASFECSPDFRWGFVDNIPALEVLCDMGQVSLLLLPNAVFPDINTRADDCQLGPPFLLNGSRSHDVPFGHRVGDQRLLKLGLDVLSSLVRRSSIHAVLSSTALEYCCRGTVESERGDDTPCPEKKSAVWGADAVKKILMQGIDQ